MKNDYCKTAHAVIDLETLGKRDDAVVLSIGLSMVTFNRDIGGFKVDGTAYFDLTGTVFEQLRMGRTIDQDTVAWWSDQARDKAAAALKSSVTSLGSHGDMLASELNTNSHAMPIMLWGYSSGFDCNKLVSLFPKLPIKFWNHRCLRTLYDALGLKIIRVGNIHHHAGDDANDQAHAVADALQILYDTKLLSTEYPE